MKAMCDELVPFSLTHWVCLITSCSSIRKEGAADLRQRKKQNCTESDKMAPEERNKENSKLGRSPKYMLIQRFAKLFFGCLAAVTSGMMYAVYLSTYHERKFWFSSRQELEREITFQGDSAIYYSFYKELLKAPSFERGVYELTHNNKTVSLKTINAVQQMTLYPELIASVLYQASGSEVHEVYKIYLFSLFLGYLLQFENSALLVSPLLSLVAALMLSKCLQMNMKKGTFMSRLLKIMYIYLVFTITVTLNFLLKMFVPHKENEHLLKFIEVKLGLNTTKNFTMNWLLCQESLQAPSQDFFLRLTQSSLLPFYVLVLIICLFSVTQVIFSRICGEPLKETVKLEDGRIGERPEIVYHVIHTILLGCLAMCLEGMKYLWTPYVCMLAAFGVCSPELWMTLFKWLRLKAVHPILLALILSMAVPTIIGFSLWKEFFPRIMTELSELQEFYDPDTVELMTWIKRQAPVAAVFAGSPQLMGVIKLCTGWMVSSLPLYNDDDLLKRNENIYQIYSKRSAEDIYKILTSYKANFLVIEDSICNEVGPVRGCRVKDLLDVANGHVVCEEGDSYAYSKYGRFCHEIKMNYSPYVNYFTRVYWNRSYFVYRINTVISFQS
ncbi:probable C-mannosyltransferase DPY19L4 isoform X5 [Egretta garzetta]|uniref:probable C-mannosyltransferase DPY19L4 isoform X5 n=1 Tax=Egretta garzetta TaxID=188379 RepID=UPI00163CAF53|nr:probable C-mannosyltransferase DPY19L4 isoform X5 [Egretta garzetta]